MFSKQFITTHTRKIYFSVCIVMHLTVLFSHFYVKIENVGEITELWEAELLDSLILINVVPGISVVVRSLGHF